MSDKELTAKTDSQSKVEYCIACGSSMLAGAKVCPACGDEVGITVIQIDL